MKNKAHYRVLMEGIRRSHQNFSAVWNEIRDAELRKRGIDPDAGTFSDYAPVWEANGVAYQAAQPQADGRNELLFALFESLPLEEFGRGETSAIDSIIDFLEIDILAFRCGYLKEDCLRVLKKLPLNDEQVNRLRQLALAMCEFRGQRRELRELARLMIPLADKSLARELQKMAADANDKYARRKAERVLKVILNSRRDLEN